MLLFVLRSLVVIPHFREVWMISLCHMLFQNKIIIISGVTESIDFNEAFEFIFKNDYPDLFNFKPGILHF